MTIGQSYNIFRLYDGVPVAYGAWEFTGIFGLTVWFTNEDGATLGIPQDEHDLKANDNWLVEEVEEVG